MTRGLTCADWAIGGSLCLSGASLLVHGRALSGGLDLSYSSVHMVSYWVANFAVDQFVTDALLLWRVMNPK